MFLNIRIIPISLVDSGFVCDHLLDNRQAPCRASGIRGDKGNGDTLMAWNLARTVEHGTTNVTNAPKFYAYFALFGAFLAGFELRDLILMVRKHSATALDYSACPLLLLPALLYTSFLVRAIRRSRSLPRQSLR